jgi:non-ribosomal peptide synthetase component F
MHFFGYVKDFFVDMLMRKKLSNSYRGLEDLTHSRFVFISELGKRLYRTGDRGKLLPNGAVQLVGRIDREVKIRGRFQVAFPL